MTQPAMLPSIESCLREQCAALPEPMQAVCRYAITGGRRTRALLLLLAAEQPDALAHSAACALEMLHAATLLQDDIFDGSAQRRGRIAAHICFGKAQAILASDWLLVRSLELAADVHPIFFRQMTRAAKSMAQTVAQELQPGSLAGPRDAQAHLEEVSSGKTAGLFAAALTAAALLRHRSADDLHRWEQVGAQIGYAYQLVDDCVDVYASEEDACKSLGQDLVTGRLTRPLLLAHAWRRKQGAEIPLGRLASAELTQAEILAIERATREPEVQHAAQRQVLDVLDGIVADAARASIPEAAIAFCTADMRRKLDLCFAALAAPRSTAARQQHPRLTPALAS